MAGNHGLKTAGWTIVTLLLAILPALVVAAFVIYPFAEMLSLFLGPSSAGLIAGSSAIAQLTRRAVYNSLLQGGLSALISFAAGLPLGFFMGRYEFRFSRALRSFLILPFFLPSIVVVTAFVDGFGPGSAGSSAGLGFLSSGLGGILAVNTFFNAPLVAMMTMLAVERCDPSLEEAAQTLGSGAFGRFVGVWGREGLIAGAGGALLAFLYSFAAFTAPLIIGGPGYFTLEAWIYFIVMSLHNLSAAALLSFVEAIALLLPALLYFIFLARGGKPFGTGRPARGRRHGIYFGAGAAYVAAWILAEIFVLASVVYASFAPSNGAFSLRNYIQLFGARSYGALGISTSAVLVNTLFYGVMTSILVTSIGLGWIYGRRKLYSRFMIAADTLQFMPLVISAVILSLSLSVTFSYAVPGGYDWMLIVIAQSVIAVPVVLRVIEAGFSAIPRSMAEAALTLRGNAFFEVDLPIARSTMASALMFGFAMSLGEFTATNFLATTHYMPLAVQIYSLQVSRLSGPAVAAASLLLFMSVLSFYLIQRLGEAFVAVR